MLEMSVFKLFMVATQLIILSYPVMLLTSFTILSYCFFPLKYIILTKVVKYVKSN